jgi:hypothetical protein
VINSCETTIGKSEPQNLEKGNDERRMTKDEWWKSLAQRRRLRRVSLYHFIILNRQDSFFFQKEVAKQAL